MEYKFYAKLQNRKRGNGEIAFMIGIAGFIIAIMIGMLLKIYYYLYMAIPMIYLIFLFARLRKRKNMLVDAIVCFKFENKFFDFAEMNYDGNIIKRERIEYTMLKCFNIFDNGNVVIESGTTCYNFWLKQDDKDKLEDVLLNVKN